MKTILAIFFTLTVLASSAQTVTGLYTGRLVNDSTKKIQNYELALSEYRDKITGYSYTTFVVNDTFYYSIKRVQGTKEGSNLIVEDDKMIANNFPETPAKGVKQVNTIPLKEQDTVRTVNGTWTTTQTKKYYSLNGAVDMARDGDSSHSALIAHLKELKIINTPAQQKEIPAVTLKTDKQKIKTEAVKKAQTVALLYNQRQQQTIQTITVSTDSLVLSFYDNGVVDGDVISVYVNDQNILSNVRLTEAAAKKTIYLNNINSTEITLTLVAENLGSLPPNTGLVVVQDGDKKYQVNFSANLQTNAAIVFNKQK
ncbi:MAG TPA: hypothetical protein VM888_07585 [Chitinophagaceae bacterium]|nr:hypothetical protein [Chitinophagaceae bacterium]